MLSKKDFLKKFRNSIKLAPISDWTLKQRSGVLQHIKTLFQWLENWNIILRMLFVFAPINETAIRYAV